MSEQYPFLNVFKACFGTHKLFGSEEPLRIFAHQRECPKTKTQWAGHLECSRGSWSFSSSEQFEKKHPLDQILVSAYLIISEYEARGFCSWVIKHATSTTQQTEMPVLSRGWQSLASSPSYTCLLQVPPAWAGIPSPEHLGWWKHLPGVWWASPVVTTGTALAWVTAPWTHLNSACTSTNTNPLLISPLTHRCAGTALHSQPVPTRHEEGMFSRTALASYLFPYNFSHSFIPPVRSRTASRRSPDTAANARPSPPAGRSHRLCPLLAQPPPAPLPLARLLCKGGGLSVNLFWKGRGAAAQGACSEPPLIPRP